MSNSHNYSQSLKIYMLGKLKNGATLLRANRLDPNLLLVLATWIGGTGREFVIWHSNNEGDTFWGHYFNDRDEAEKRYKELLNNY